MTEARNLAEVPPNIRSGGGMTLRDLEELSANQGQVMVKAEETPKESAVYPDVASPAIQPEIGNQTEALPAIQFQELSSAKAPEIINDGDPASIRQTIDSLFEQGKQQLNLEAEDTAAKLTGLIHVAHQLMLYHSQSLEEALGLDKSNRSVKLQNIWGLQLDSSLSQIQQLGLLITSMTEVWQTQLLGKLRAELTATIQEANQWVVLQPLSSAERQRLLDEIPHPLHQELEARNRSRKRSVIRLIRDWLSPSHIDYGQELYNLLATEVMEMAPGFANLYDQIGLVTQAFSRKEIETAQEQELEQLEAIHTKAIIAAKIILQFMPPTRAARNPQKPLDKNQIAEALVRNENANILAQIAIEELDNKQLGRTPSKIAEDLGIELEELKMIVGGDGAELTNQLGRIKTQVKKFISTALSKDVIEEMQKYASNKQRLTTPNVYRQEAALYKRQAALIRPKNPADSLSQAVGEFVGGVQEQLPQLLKELNTHPIVGELRQKAGGSFDITESLIINICQMMEARLDREGARLAYSTLAELIRDRLAAARDMIPDSNLATPLPTRPLSIAAINNTSPVFRSGNKNFIRQRPAQVEQS